MFTFHYWRNGWTNFSRGTLQNLETWQKSEFHVRKYGSLILSFTTSKYRRICRHWFLWYSRNPYLLNPLLLFFHLFMYWHINVLTLHSMQDLKASQFLSPLFSSGVSLNQFLHKFLYIKLNFKFKWISSLFLE